MKKRELNIEFLRIVAIICTIIIHVSNVYINSFSKISNANYLISVILNSMARICVPLFFMISGAFLIEKEYNFSKYIKKILKYLLILLIWSLLYYIVLNSKFEFKDIILSIFNANKTSRHLWYMYALIGIYIVLPFISSMCKNMDYKKENLFLILWFVISGLQVIFIPLSELIVGSKIEISYPVPIVGATYYLGYFICGHILYKKYNNRKVSKKMNFYLLVSYIISTLITAISTYLISIKLNKPYNVMFWYRSIFISVSSISIFLLFLLNKEKFKSEKIQSISSYTFGIYLVHVLYLIVIKKYFMFINFNSLYIIPLVSLLILLLSYITVYILKRIPIIKELL